MTLDAVGDFAGTSRYQVVRRLGGGGMGVVYEALDRERQARVALKTLVHLDAAALYRFKREFRALADIAHENLVQLHELVADESQWFFVMELVAGVDLLSYVWRRAAPLPAAPASPLEATSPAAPGLVAAGAAAAAPGADDGPAPTVDHGRLRGALRQLAAAVQAIHEAGTLHRDIKPSNVLVDGTGRVVLLDFGVAADLGAGADRTDAKVLLGTPAYMAPEQCASGPLTAAADWYAVGVVLFEALTGRLPFGGAPLDIVALKQREAAPRASALAPGVPADLDELCATLLERRPAARPPGPELVRRLGGAPAPAAAPDAPFVGRDEALGTLAAALASLAGGRPATLRVQGRSGVGKSALVRHFLDGVAARGQAVVLAGRCYERESVPFKACDAIIDALSRHLLSLGDAECAAVLPRDTPALARVFPVLRRVDAVAAAPRRESPDVHALRAQAFGALRELLARLAVRRPIVLFIDDCQWADADSALLLSALTVAPDPPALLIVLTYRSEDLAASPGLRGFLDAGRHAATGTIVLEALSSTDSRRLAAALLGGAGDDELAERIATEADGSPFFIGELARHVQATGQPAPGGVRLEQVVHERLQALPAPALRLLEVVAVAGRPIRRAAAARAAGLAPAAEATAVALLRTRHLVRAGAFGAAWLETYHDRIREAVVESLAADALRERHLRLATVLRERGDADAEALFAHCAAAGLGELAARYAETAADQAAGQLAFDRAARLYGHALERTAPDAAGAHDLRVRLAGTLAAAGRGAESAAAYLAAATPGLPAAQAMALRRKAADQLLRSGHIDEGVRELGAVLGGIGLRLSGSPLVAFVRVLWQRALLRARGLRHRVRPAGELSPRTLERIDLTWAVSLGLSTVDPLRGVEFQTRNLRLALRAGEPYRLARALALEAGYCATGGRRGLARAARTIAAAERLAAAAGAPHAAGLCAMWAGAVGYLSGDFARGRARCEQALAIYREQCTGVAWEIVSAEMFVLSSLYYLGELRELTRRVPPMLAAARQLDDRYAATNLRTSHANVAWLVGDDPGEARRHVGEAMAEWSPTSYHLQHYYEFHSLGQIDLYEGRGADSCARIARNWSALRRALLLQIQIVRIQLHDLRGRSRLAAAAAGDPDLAAAAEQDAQRLAREGRPWCSALADLLRAGAATVRGDTPVALAWLTAARRGFEHAAMRLHAEVARRRAGQLRGGAAGAALVAAADAWLASQGVRRPAAMAAMLAPGYRA
ncbi:MAG TPA: protein kinase [Polyangia bacterium]